MKRYEREIEGGIKVDFTRGIDPQIGAEFSIITRNNHSFRLLTGMPGTGKYTHSKSTSSVSYVLMIIAVMFIAAFAVLTMAAINADYRIGMLLISFFSADNIVYTLLFFAISISAVLCVIKYKDFLYKRYLKYLDNLSRECKNVESAMESASGTKFDILKHYRDCIEIEKEYVETEVILRALQESFNPSKYRESIELYNEKVYDLEKRLMDARLKADRLDVKGRYMYQSLCECFEILFTGARFWDISTYEKPFSGHPWVGAIFTTGTFDYVFSGSYPPVIKTNFNGILSIFPDFIAHVRSTTDFDIYPLDSVHMENGLVPGHPSYGYLKIPELGLAFTTSDPMNMDIFVKSFEAYRNGTYDPEHFRQLDSLTEDVALYCIMSRKITRERIQKHFDMGISRTIRILKQLSSMGIITEEDRDGNYELIVWDVEKVSQLVEKRREEITRSRQA